VSVGVDVAVSVVPPVPVDSEDEAALVSELDDDVVTPVDVCEVAAALELEAIDVPVDVSVSVALLSGTGLLLTLHAAVTAASAITLEICDLFITPPGANNTS
jgi:hypothetical protein